MERASNSIIYRKYTECTEMAKTEIWHYCSLFQQDLNSIIYRIRICIAVMHEKEEDEFNITSNLGKSTLST